MNGRAFVLALLLAVPLTLGAEEAAPTKHAIQPPRANVAQNPAEAPDKAPDRATRDLIRRLIFAFTSDDWQERDNAFKRVVEQDQAAVPELEAVLKQTTDTEVIVRARKALVEIRERVVRGTFIQVDARVRDSLGNVRDGDTKEGWIAVGDGKATWYQRFGGTLTAQTYSYDISKRLVLDEHGDLEVPLTYLTMETQIGYTPESLDPKLQFHKSSSGELKVTFVGTDGMGQRTTAQFAVAQQK